MAIYKVDGVDGTPHLPKKFVTLNTVIPTSTTITKGEVMMIDTAVVTAGAGYNVVQGAGDDLALAIGVAAETVVNSSASATLATTVRVQVAGHNDDVTGDAAIAVGQLCGHDGVNPELCVHSDSTSDITTRPFALCVVAATTTPTVNYTDLEILIYDHGFYG
jgi:hypothetical protein